MHWGSMQSVYIKEQWRLLTWIDCPSVTYDDVGFMKTIGCSGTGLPCSAANALKENIRIKIYPLDNQYFFYVNSTCRKRLELFQKHIWLPRCKTFMYKLRHYEFRTLYKAELNIHHIRVKDYIIMIKWQRS